MRWILVAVMWAGAAQASDLITRYQAADEAILAEMARAAGDDPAKWMWSATRKAQSTCALRMLAERRGTKAAARYVSAVETAQPRACKINRLAEFGRLSAEIHRDARIRMQRDLVPITQACGIGL